MKYFLFIIILLTFVSVAFAKISAPPPLPGESAAEQHYLYEIFQNFNRLEVVTTKPDGNRSGKKGDMLHLQTGGKYYHCENVDSLTTWRCVELTDVP